MGGTSKTSSTTNQTQHTDPYAPTSGPINSLIGQLGNIDPTLTATENSALSGLAANAQQPNQFAPQISSLASSLLGGGGPDRTGMINDAYSQYQSSLNPTARGDFVNPESNPQLQGYLSTISNDISNRVNGQFASAGRDFSGAHAGALGRGIAAGTAPVLYDAYNQARNQQIGAQDKLYGAGGQTAGQLAGLDQLSLTNKMQGIDASKAATEAQNSPLMAQLAVEAQKRGIPLEAIKGLLGPLAGIGAAFGTTTGTGQSTGTQQMSGAQQFAMIAQGLGSLFGGGQKAQPTSL